MIAKSVKCKVYLEGVRVPFYSVQLTMQPNTMSTLALAVPPSRILFDIRPRTLVQVFYDDGRGWRVFFEGEVAGHGFSKHPTQGRQMTLLCSDFSNYWLYSYAHYLNRVNTEQLSLEDTIFFFTGPIAESTDRKESSKFFPVRGVGTEAHSILTQGSKDIVDGVRKIFTLVKDINAFYKDRFTKLKVNERLASLPDGQLQILIDPTAIEGLSETLGNQESFVPIFQVLSIILQSAYQMFWSVPTSSVDATTKKPPNFLLLPATFLTAPPRCNVIFPDLHEGFNYSRRMLDEPTRFEVYSGTSNEGMTKQFAYAPAAFRKKLVEIREAQRQNKDLRSQNLLIESDNPEFDEMSRGVVPGRQALMRDGFMAVRAAIVKVHGADKAREKLESFKQQIADFEFLLRKYGMRELPIDISFNPNIHPAFPVLLVDKEARLFGSPVQLVHVIDAAGAARTALQCMYARHKDVVTDFEIPPWINKSYVPEGIGEDTYSFTDPVTGGNKTVDGAYPRLLGKGMRSILSQALDIKEPDPANPSQTREVFRKPANEQEAADALLDLYYSSGDKATFIDEYTVREIMTEAEALAFLGATKINEEELTGSVYDLTKRRVVEDFKAELLGAGFAIKEV